MPAFQFLFADFRIDRRFKDLIDRPVLFDFFKTVPVADCKTSQISSSHSSRLNADRTVDRCVDQISLCLHQEVICACAAVYFQGGKINVGICLHGSQDIICLISERFEGRTNDMVFIYPTCQADDRSAGILIPIWSTKSGESRYNITAVCIFHFLCHIFAVVSGINQAQFITQPLDCRTGDKDRTFQSICNLSVKSPGNRGDQSIVGKDRFLSGVHQKEASGSVSILRISRFKAGLTEKCRLLISGSTGNRDRSAEDGRICLSVNAAGRLRCRKHTAWDLKFFENLVIPV